MWWSKQYAKWCDAIDEDHDGAVRAMMLGPLVVLGGPVACIALMLACEPSRPAEKPALYELELTSCTERSSTLTESIVCENEVRGRYGRPLRALPRPKDGGP